MLRLLLLFTVVPIVELTLLIRLGSVTGLPLTLGIVLATGVIGAALARREGFKTWLAIHERLEAGEMPTAELSDGALILVAGVLLVTPGLLTDAVGFGLLIPAVRRRVKRWLSRRWSGHIRVVGQPGRPPVEIVADHDGESQAR